MNPPTFFLSGSVILYQGFVLVKQALYRLIQPYGPFYSGYFGDGSGEQFGWRPNCDPLALSLLGRQDCRHELPSPSFNLFLLKKGKSQQLTSGG
jgi:hypothetical protein